MSLLKPSFLRHQNANGTFDSVCKNCFVTVATAPREFELEEPERNHVCDPQVVQHWKEVAEGKETKYFSGAKIRKLSFAEDN